MLAIRQNQYSGLAFLLDAAAKGAFIFAGELHQLPQCQRVFRTHMKEIRNQWISFVACDRI